MITGSRTPEYRAWVGLKDRCYNENCINYHRYGGRGITVCDRWKDSFINFYQDMGPRPTDQHSIDRINNNGNYEPGNCRWATTEQQVYNRSTNISIQTETGSINSKEAMERYNLSKGALFSRLERNVPLDIPVKEYNRKYLYKGELLTTAQLAAISNIPASIIRGRIAEGMDIEKAVVMPIKSTPTYFYNGENLTIIELSKRTGIPAYNLRHHLRKGLTVDEIIDICSNRNIKYNYQGNKYTLTELAKYLKCGYNSLNVRLNKGQTLEEAIEGIRSSNTIKTYTYQDKSLSLRELTEITGYKPKALKRHLDRGHTVDESMLIIDKNIAIRAKSNSFDSLI